MTTLRHVSTLHGWRHLCHDNHDLAGVVIEDVSDDGRWFRCAECNKSTRTLTSSVDGFERTERDDDS